MITKIDKRPNVLLIYVDPFFGSNLPPTGIGYIAAYLKSNGIKTELWDYTFAPASGAAISKAAKELAPPIIGICCCPWNYKFCMNLANLLKQTLPESWIIIGGVHAGNVAKHCFDDSAGVDIVVRGEAELHFHELVCKLLGKESFENVPGISYMANGEFVSTAPPTKVPDINKMPSPYLENVFDIERYQAAGISLARGCPHSCLFCSWGSPKEEGRYRPYDLDHIFAEIDYLHYHGIKCINPTDGTFNARPSTVFKIAEYVLKNDYKFEWHDIDMRADRASEELLTVLKKMGAVTVGFGYESCHEKTQKLLKKNVDPEEVAKKTAIAKKIGLLTHCGMIVGLPGETEQDVIASADFAINKIAPNELGVFHLRLQPGTILYDNYKFFGLDVGAYLSDRCFLVESDCISYSRIVELVEDITAKVSEISQNEIIKREKHVNKAIFTYAN